MKEALAETLLICPDVFVPPDERRKEFLFGER